MKSRGVRIPLLAVAGLVAIGVVPARAQETAADAPPVKVTPYGIVYFDLFWNSSATNNADLPLWALAGPGNASATVRATRLGLRVTAPPVSGARVAGIVEVDFYGGFPSIGIGDNMGILRLRLANVRLDWERTAVVAGQDWMVFAPLNPASITSAGIPLMAASGNPWARIPQIRVEHRLGAALLQGAVLAPSSGDFDSAFLYQPPSGALSEQPFVQGRAAFDVAKVGSTQKPATLAGSGHYGRTRVLQPVDRTLDSWGVAGDWTLPLTSRLALSGEVFAGRNLAGFQGAVFQGINPASASEEDAGLVLDGPRGIGTRGGWTQLTFAATSTITLLGTYGLDDPRDEDFVSVEMGEARLRNLGVAAELQHKLSAQLSWALQYKRTVTHLQVAGRRTNDHLNLGVSFTF